MQEAFLHYLWQYQYFDKSDLRTVGGETLQVLHPGFLNRNAGPDFSNARIRIGDMSWVGTVEVHIRSSDWIAHRHSLDDSYESVILHVVWEDDKPVIHDDGTVLPAIELRGRVSDELMVRYRKLVDSGFDIPCSSQLHTIPGLVRNNMLDRTVVERLEIKAHEVTQILEHNSGDWEETAYQLLARNFGFKVNADPFLQLARSLPYKFLRKHADHPVQVEAMLFGVAGFLVERSGLEYHRILRREYGVLRGKYRLERAELNTSQWKFMRLRPANFPSLRLAQFAALVTGRMNMFSNLIATSDLTALSDWLKVGQSEFWTNHYSFKRRKKETVWSMGKSSIENVAINTLIPLLVAYGKSRDEHSYVERAEALLQQVSAEENRITRIWSDAGWEVKNAFDSQALIQLFNSYCTPRQCLNCSIGAALLKPGECLTSSHR
jgi:hypothetical protein